MDCYRPRQQSRSSISKRVFCRGYFSRKRAKAQSAAAFSEVFFAPCAFAREIFLPPMRPQSFVQRWSVDDFIRQHPVDSVAATINASKLIVLENRARNT